MDYNNQNPYEQNSNTDPYGQNNSTNPYMQSGTTQSSTAQSQDAYGQYGTQQTTSQGAYGQNQGTQDSSQNPYYQNSYQQSSYQQNSYQQPQYQGYQPYQYNGDMEEPMSLKEWLITDLLLMIPCVNFILMFVWAFSSSEKKSKSNFFKAQLIFAGCILAFYIVLIFIFGIGAGFAAALS